MSLSTCLQRNPGSLPAAPNAGQFFHFASELSDALLVAASQERCSPAALASELLAAALARRGDEMEAERLWNSLTPREQEVASLACRGLTNRQIACRLGISSETVKTHIRNTGQKFNLKRKSDLRLALLYRNYETRGE